MTLAPSHSSSARSSPTSSQAGPLPQRSLNERFVVVLMAVLVAAASCAGPRRPFEVGVKNYATNVILGSANKALAEQPAPPPVALALPSPAGNPLAGGPAPTFPKPAPEPVKSRCPTADPTAPAVAAPGHEISHPPAPATYPFRAKGGYEVGGANPVLGVYPSQESRTVGHIVTTAAGGFAFDVAVTLGDTVTTTTYEVVPEGPASGNAVANPPTSGLFITKVVTKDVDGTHSFAPTVDAATGQAITGLLLLELPANAGETWNTSGLDATTGEVMAFTGTVVGEQRVDACGIVLGALRVHADGSITSCVTTPPETGTTTTVPVSACSPAQAVGGAHIDPSATTTFTADYDLMPEYGGIAGSDHIRLTGVQGSTPIARDLLSTIDVEPPA